MAAIPGVIAEWSGIPFLVNIARTLEPFWFGTAFHSTYATRVRAFADPSNQAYTVELPDGTKLTINDKRLLKYQFPGDPKPANEMVKLDIWDRLWALFKSLVVNGFVALSVYFIVRAFTGSHSTAFEAAVGFFCAWFL